MRTGLGIPFQNKITVPSAVASIVTKNQPIYECVKQKLINYHALAAKIETDVEDLTGRKTSINTIVVAIKRFSDTITDIKEDEPLDVLRDARITLASRIADVTIKAKKSELLTILKHITEIESKLNEPPHIFQLSNSIKLVADAVDYETLIRARLSKWRIYKEEMGASKLSLHLASEVEKTPGFASLITQLLYRSGINILNTYIGEETILILDQNDGPKAFEILEREIVRSKKGPFGQ
ncbi:MAG: hypothetical protein HYU39_01600 [Thaumarchaeota archaeon]|nr:hypothetical protein [Nitrososphaerota archaeon]